MVPQSQKRKPKNSSKVNLLLSLAFHSVIVVGLVYVAARQGLLGKQLKKIAVEMVKEKPPEKPKEPDKPKEEPPKVVEQPKMVSAPKIEPPKEVAPPPTSVAAPPVSAPAAVDVASFSFDGGKMVETSSDPVTIYKGQVEYSLRSRWVRPDDVEDQDFVAEVEVTVGSSGQISDPVWKKSSGNTKWDDSVRRALTQAKVMTKLPPANFPPRVVVRFDVVASAPLIQ